MMLDSTHTSATMSMRGNTLPTSLSPPHQSRPAGHPPNRQPVTVGEEERDGRGTTSRRTLTREAPERRPPQTALRPPTSHTSSSHPREGGHHLRRTASQLHAAGGGPRPGQAPAAARPAAATSHDTPPANHNRKAGKADALSSATGPSTV